MSRNFDFVTVTKEISHTFQEVIPNNCQSWFPYVVFFWNAKASQNYKSMRCLIVFEILIELFSKLAKYYIPLKIVLRVGFSYK